VLLWTSTASAQSSGSLRGQVVGSQGQPLEGVEIVVRGLDRTVSTNASGAFRFDGIPLGEQSVVARRPGYLPADTTVTILADAIVEVALELTERPLELDQIEIVGARFRPNLQGYVHDTEGRPLEDVEIILRGLNRSVQTNARGIFRFDSLESKPYQLTARLPGYAAAQSLIRVYPAEPTEVALRLRQLPQELPEYFVEGVRQRGLYGVVGTPDLEPVVGAKVQVHGGGTSAITDSAGRFALPAIKPGEYLVQATHPGLSGRPIHVSVPRGGSREVTMTLEPIGQGRGPVPGIQWVYHDLGLRLSFQPASRRVNRAELARQRGRLLCDIARVRTFVGRRDVAIVVDGIQVLYPWSLCAFDADELALIEFPRGGCVSMGQPVKLLPGDACIMVWRR
jgi:protocatechuate 3,4-dioxygenase beta subunit